MPFYDNSVYNKDINLLKTDPVLSLQASDLFAGPKKISGPQYLMYISRGDLGILQNEQYNSFEIQVEELNDVQSDDQEDEDDDKDEEISVERDYLAESMKTDRHNVPIHSPNTKSNVDLPDTVSGLGKGSFFNHLMKVSFQESVPETNPV